MKISVICPGCKKETGAHFVEDLYEEVENLKLEKSEREPVTISLSFSSSTVSSSSPLHTGQASISIKSRFIARLYHKRRLGISKIPSPF